MSFGRCFQWIQFSKGEFKICGKSVIIEEEFGEHTGSTVWDCAIVLSKYLEANSFCLNSFKITSLDHFLNGKSVIELGAGCGLCGIVASVLGASKVTITDIPNLIPLIRRNVHLNHEILSKKDNSKSILTDSGNDCTGKLLDDPNSHSVIVSPLDWNDEKSCESFTLFDFILCSDLVFHKKTIDPLISTLLHLSHHETCILMAHKDRHDDVDDSLASALQNNFECEEIDWESLHPDYRHPRIHIFCLRPVLNVS